MDSLFFCSLMLAHWCFDAKRIQRKFLGLGIWMFSILILCLCCFFFVLFRCLQKGVLIELLLGFCLVALLMNSFDFSKLHPFLVLHPYPLLFTLQMRISLYISSNSCNLFSWQIMLHFFFLAFFLFILIFPPL